MKVPKKKPLDSRISCRIHPALKAKVEAAAGLSGLSITSFTEMALNEKVQAVLQEHERIVLSERAFESFLEAVQGPSAQPSEELLKAVAAYNAPPAQ